MEKATVRKIALSNRESLGEGEREIFSKKISSLVVASSFYTNCKSLMLYSAMKYEVNLSLLFSDALRRGKSVFFPRTSSAGIKIIPVRCYADTVWEKRAFGILEPVLQSAEEPDAIDVIFVPGVAFDRKLNRVGFGKGFYDRFLQTMPRSLKVGVAFSVQIFEEIDVDPWDIKMDMIVTEMGYLGDA